MKNYINTNSSSIFSYTLSLTIVCISLLFLLVSALTSCSSPPKKKSAKIDDKHIFAKPSTTFRKKPINANANELSEDISEAKKLLETGYVDQAAELIADEQLKKIEVSMSELREFWEVRSDIAYSQHDIAEYLVSEQKHNSMLTNKAREKRSEVIFHRLLELDRFSLLRIGNSIKDNNFASDWISLALQVTNLPATRSLQKVAISRWRKNHRHSSLIKNMPDTIEKFLDTTADIATVGLLLPLSGPLAPFGKAIELGFSAASKSLGLQVNVYNVSDTVSLNLAIDKMLKEGVDTVVGPLDKKLIGSIWQQSNRFKQVLSLNYVPNLEPKEDFAQFGLGIEDEARLLAKISLYSDKNNVLVIAEKGTKGTRALRVFRQYMPTSRFNQLVFGDTKSLAKGISEAVNVSASDLKKYRSLLKEYEADPESFDQSPTEKLLQKNSVDTVVVFAGSINSAQVKPLLDFYYAFDTPVLATSRSYSLDHAQNLGKEYEGIYITDIPVLGINVPQWHHLIKTNLDQFDPSLVRFYALGIDAAIAITNQKKLTLFPGFAVKGTTGTIAYDQESRTIARSPLLYLVQGGKLVPASFRTTECSEEKRLCL